MHKQMGCWSAENATRAYLKTMKMGKNGKEPDVAEFVSALAAGNNAQLMVVACAGIAGSTTLALVAAAQQTGGRVVCVVPSQKELHSSKRTLGPNASHLEFAIGNAQILLLHHYIEADFVVIDCKLENHEGILGAMEAVERHRNIIVLGYNAFCKDSWRWSGSHSQLLPIGQGLLVTRISAKARGGAGRAGGGPEKRSHWVVKVDKCTGEEHVFRVRTPQSRVTKA